MTNRTCRKIKYNYEDWVITVTEENKRFFSTAIKYRTDKEGMIEKIVKRIPRGIDNYLNADAALIDTIDICRNADSKKRCCASFTKGATPFCYAANKRELQKKLKNLGLIAEDIFLYLINGKKYE